MQLVYDVVSSVVLFVLFGALSALFAFISISMLVTPIIGLKIVGILFLMASVYIFVDGINIITWLWKESQELDRRRKNR